MPDYFTYYVYILASKPTGKFYVGITNNLSRRIWEHQTEVNPKAFTARYNVKSLVYFEVFDNVMTAILYEKRIKKWRREWKFNLVTKTNPHWNDLSTNWQHVA